MTIALPFYLHPNIDILQTKTISTINKKQKDDREKENYAELERENDLFSDNQDRPFYLQGICGRELTFKFLGIVAEFC
jgi:hypothetical protein